MIDLAVLVVEDEALILMDIVEQLEAEGFKVYEASNGARAMRLLDLHPDISLLFTDIDMPGSMDGLKLAAAVRNGWPPIKIIVTSGARMIEASDMPGGSMFFSKPYQHASVMAAMLEMTS